MKKNSTEENKKILHLKYASIKLEAETRSGNQKKSLTRPVINKFLGIKQLKETKANVGNPSQLTKKPTATPVSNISNISGPQIIVKEKSLENKSLAKINNIIPSPMMSLNNNGISKVPSFGSVKKPAFKTKLIHPLSGKQKLTNPPRNKAHEINMSLGEIKRNPTFSPSSGREKLVVDLRKSRDAQVHVVAGIGYEKKKSETVIIENILAMKSINEKKSDLSSQNKVGAYMSKATTKEIFCNELDEAQFELGENGNNSQAFTRNENKLDTILSDGILKEFSFLNGSNVVIYSDALDINMNGKNPIDELQKFLTKFRDHEEKEEDYEEFFKLNPMDIKGSVLYEETLLLIGEKHGDKIANIVSEDNERDPKAEMFNDKIVACLLNGVEDASYYEGYLDELIKLFKIGVWKTEKQIKIMWTFLCRMAPKAFLIAESKKEFLAEIFLRLLIQMQNFCINEENVGNYIEVTENLIKDIYIRQQIKGNEALSLYKENLEKEMEKLFEYQEVGPNEALAEIGLIYFITAILKYYEFVEGRKGLTETIILLLKFVGEYLKLEESQGSESPRNLLIKQIKINVKKIIGCAKFYEKGILSLKTLEEVVIKSPPLNLAETDFQKSLIKRVKIMAENFN